MFAEHYFPDVPQIGNVAVSRHAQERAEGDGITLEDFKTTLFKGRTIPQGGSIEIRELNGIQIVIERKPTPFRGAALATTCYRMKQQARAR